MSKLLTTTEAAEQWRVKPVTVRTWRHKGLIKPVKLGKKVLYPEELVERVKRSGLNTSGITTL